MAVEDGNGIFTRYKYPVVTAAHTPVFWRYDLDEKSNPYLMERIGMNATMNSGAIKWNGKYLMVVRVEGADRKSFFAVAESPNGIDNSGSGIIPSPCPKTRFRQRMYTTCASRLMRTAGFTVSSAPNATTTMRLPVIVLGYGYSCHCPHQGFKELGTPARPEDQEPATQRSAAPGVCRWQVCPLYPSAGWLY